MISICLKTLTVDIINTSIIQPFLAPYMADINRFDCSRLTSSQPINTVLLLLLVLTETLVTLDTRLLGYCGVSGGSSLLWLTTSRFSSMFVIYIGVISAHKIAYKVWGYTSGWKNGYSIWSLLMIVDHQPDIRPMLVQHHWTRVEPALVACSVGIGRRVCSANDADSSSLRVGIILHVILSIISVSYS